MKILSTLKIFILISFLAESTHESILHTRFKTKVHHHHKKLRKSNKSRKLPGVTGLPGVPEFPDVTAKFDVLYQGPLVKLNLGEGVAYGDEKKIKDYSKENKTEGKKEKTDLLKSILIVDAPAVKF